MRTNTEWAPELDQDIEQAEQPEQPGAIFHALLAERKFDINAIPERPVPVLKLGGQCVGTPGNIMAIQAGIKSGKTAVVGAINAAFFLGDLAHGCDLLGFGASNPEGHALLHFDTEQSRFDHDQTIRRAITRAGIAVPPSWFMSFSMADLPQEQRLACLTAAIEDAIAEHGGIRVIILDGVADFMRDPNDAEEAFGFVDLLHQLAIRHDCLIVVVIHENPGSDAGKTRGHLGSQLARKAETNLRLAKDAGNGITTVWADYARHCHIPKHDGECFAWSDEAKMHVSMGTAGEIRATVKTAKMREEAMTVFGDGDALGYGELVTAITEGLGVSKRTAERRVTTYQSEGIITKGTTGNYTLKP